MLLNFTAGVQPYKKYRYQEGKENDCQFLCGNGTVDVSQVFLEFSWSI